MDAQALTFEEYWEVRALDLALDSLVQHVWESSRCDEVIALSQRVHQVERACFHCLPAYRATPAEAALVNAADLDAMLRYVIRRLTTEEITALQRFYGRDMQRYLPESSS
jgi:hypothetical protein